LRLFGVLAGLAVSSAEAAEELGTFSIQLENDFFARATNTDRHYTNGFRLAWVSAPNEGVPNWVSRPLSPPDPFFATAGVPTTRRFGFALGQSIFTPDDTESRNLVRNDRPYAGWLYTSFSYQSTYEPKEHRGSGLQDTFALELGVVGPWALGEEVQNSYHRLINVSESNGWRHQLRNEPGVSLVVERRYRTDTLYFGSGDSLGADVIPNVAVSLGNVATNASIGGLLRIGRAEGLGSDFGPPRIRPSLPGSENFYPQSGLSWYFFIGAEARAVGRDIFLDGNTFRDSYHVDKRYVVGDFQAGLAFLYRGFRISYTHVVRSPEFKQQTLWDQFGALSISANF
jgi:hypothetical protein